MLSRHYAPLLLAGLCLLLSACANAPQAKLSHLRGTSMGTYWQVSLVLPPNLTLAQARAGIQGELDQVDQQMSTWKPDSNLSRYNQAPAGSWQTIPAEFLQVLQRALALAKATQGAYDPTVGPLVNLWGFGPTAKPNHPPSKQAIENALQRVGWQRIKVRPAKRQVLQPGNVYLDLSSVAKGFAVDEVARWLLQQGSSHFLITVGGEVRAQGNKPDGSPWRVGVEIPGAAAAAVTSANQVGQVITLHNQAIATSGDYRHYFEDDAHYYSHHIDPRTGWPVPHKVASVSVVADTTLKADPLGTALSVLGPVEGMAFAREHHLAVLMIVHDGKQTKGLMTPKFKALLTP